MHAHECPAKWRRAPGPRLLPLRCTGIDCNCLKAQAAQQAIHSCAKIKISCLAQTSVILWEKLPTVHSHTERNRLTPEKGWLDVEYVRGRVVPGQMIFSSVHKQCVRPLPYELLLTVPRKENNWTSFKPVHLTKSSRKTTQGGTQGFPQSITGEWSQWWTLWTVLLECHSSETEPIFWCVTLTAMIIHYFS